MAINCLLLIWQTSPIRKTSVHRKDGNNNTIMYFKDSTSAGSLKWLNIQFCLRTRLWKRIDWNQYSLLNKYKIVPSQKSMELLTWTSLKLNLEALLKAKRSNSPKMSIIFNLASRVMESRLIFTMTFKVLWIVDRQK